MDPHGTYHSALHVLNIAVQARGSLSEAMDITEALWDLYPPPLADDGEVLVALLEGAWFEATCLDVDAGSLAAVVKHFGKPGNLLCLLLRYTQKTDARRWAVVQAVRGSAVDYAVCLQPDDPEGQYLPLDKALAGPAVVIGQLPAVTATILADVRAGDC